MSWLLCLPPFSSGSERQQQQKKSIVGDVYAQASGPTDKLFVDLMLELGGRKMLLELDIQKVESASKSTTAQRILEAKRATLVKLVECAETLAVLASQTDVQWLNPSFTHYSPSELRAMPVFDLIAVAQRTSTLLLAKPDSIFPIGPAEGLLESISVSDAAAAAAGSGS